MVKRFSGHLEFTDKILHCPFVISNCTTSSRELVRDLVCMSPSTLNSV